MKFAVSFIVGLSFLLLTASVGAAPGFPWKTYGEVPIEYTSPACGGAAVGVVVNDEWKVLSNDTADMFIHFTAGEPDYVFLTKGVAGGGITVVKILTIAEARAAYPDPCLYLASVPA